MDAVSWFQQQAAVSLDLLRAAGTDVRDAVIDVGGGTSPFTAELCRRGYTDVTVLDISAKALDLARAQLGEAHDGVHWIETDVTAFAPQKKYRFWHDRAVFHFLTAAADQQRYADVLRRAMLPGGQVVIGAFAPEGPMRCSGLNTMQYDGPTLARTLGRDFTLLEERRETHQTPSGAEQLFAWMRFRYDPDPAV